MIQKKYGGKRGVAERNSDTLEEREVPKSCCDIGVPGPGGKDQVLNQGEGIKTTEKGKTYGGQRVSDERLLRTQVGIEGRVGYDEPYPLTQGGFGA